MTILIIGRAGIWIAQRFVSFAKFLEFFLKADINHIPARIFSSAVWIRMFALRVKGEVPAVFDPGRFAAAVRSAA